MKKCFHILTVILMILPALQSCKKINTDSDYVAETGVSLDQPESIILIVGSEKTLHATVTPSNATYKAVIWSSSNEDVATVNEDGKVTAKAAGDATITATTDNKGLTVDCHVKVISAEPVSVAVVKTDARFSDGVLALAEGESFQLEAEARTSQGSNTFELPSVWTLTEGDDYFTVTTDGKITAKSLSGATEATGKVKVELTGYPAISDILTVKVLQKPTSMNGFTFTGVYTPNPDGEVILKKGKSTALIASFKPETAIQTLEVSTSNSDILTASVNGKFVTLNGVASSVNPVTVTIKSPYNASLSKSFKVYVFDYDKNDVKPGDYVYCNGSTFLSKDCGLRQVGSSNIYVDASGKRTNKPTTTGTVSGYTYIGVIASTMLPEDDDFMGCGWLAQCKNKSNASELYGKPRNFRKSKLCGLSNAPSTHALVIKWDQGAAGNWQKKALEVASEEGQVGGIYVSQLNGILAFSKEQKDRLNNGPAGLNYSYCSSGSGFIAYLLQWYFNLKSTDSNTKVLPVSLISAYTDVPTVWDDKGTTGWFLPGELEWSLILWNLPLVKASLQEHGQPLSGDYWSTCEAEWGNTDAFYYTVSNTIKRSSGTKNTRSYLTRAVLYL